MTLFPFKSSSVGGEFSSPSRLPYCGYLICMLGILWTLQGRAAQTAFVSDAWWSFQQDCNGDGCRAGTLPGEMARLNWEPDVTNCVGSFLVFEKVYSRACGTLPWTPIYTNNLHAITACRSLNQQLV